MQEYELLHWDSAFFGFKVGKIIPATLDVIRLEKILTGLKRQNVSLVYWASDSDSVESKTAGQSAGGQLVDRKTTYIRDLEAFAEDSFERSSMIREYEGQTANDALENLAVQSGEYSRFKVDPRIPNDRFVELYRTWIRKSVSKAIADAVLVVYGDNDEVCGMITLGEKNGRGEIGLIAVAASARGKGYGRLLVGAALHFFSSAGYTRAQVVTQGDNKAACRLYEAVGFQVESCENFFHFWLT